MEEKTDTHFQSIDIRNINVQSGLVALLQSFIGDRTVSIKISNNQLRILTLLLEVMPDFFGKMANHLTKITSDNVIDMNDLPEFLLLVTELINMDVKSFKKLKLTRGDVIDAIEAIIVLLIDQDVIKTGKNKDMFLTLLRVSVKMLDAKVNLDKTIMCSWFTCC